MRRVCGPRERIHIEVRGLHRPDTQLQARTMERDLLALPGVCRAEVNGHLGRVTVWHNPEVASRVDVVAAVARIEADLGLADDVPAPRSAQHPGDLWQWARHGVRLGAALAGAGYAVGAALLPVPAIPVVVPALASLVEHSPVLRGLVASVLGQRAATTLLEVGAKGGDVLAQQPSSLLVGAVMHGLALREARARYRTWQEWDEVLSHREGGHRVDPVAAALPRPTTLPDGPVERVANLVGSLGLGSATALAVLMQAPQRAVGVLRAGVSRAARTGHGSFAAQLGTSLARRGVLVLDPAVLRCLDRVTCVVIDAGILVTDGGREPEPLAEALLDAARQAGTVILSGLPAGGPSGFGELPVLDGPDMDRSIQELQEQGHVVLLVSAADSAAGRAALAVADVGIGIAGRAPTVPWEAGLLTGPDLASACAVLRSVPLAHTVSKRSAQLALGGSVLGGLLAGLGPATRAADRAAIPVYAMTLLSLALASWYAAAAQRIPAPVPVRRTAWYAMPADAVLDELHSSAHGLDVNEARRRDDERPVDPADSGVGLGRAVFDELANPITPALAIGAGVSAGIGAVFDAVLISGALGMSALLGGVQQVGAQRAVRRLGQLNTMPVTVRRGEQVISTDPSGLVPGDVIELAAGDAVPADCRLLEVDGLEADEAALTGESQLVSKIVDATPEPAVADRRCMVYQGTVIAAGSGVAVVVATGVDTEIGAAVRIGDAGSATAPATGVAHRLQSLTKLTLQFSLTAGAILLGSDLLRGHSAGHALGRAVSLAVAAVPEGLPFVATVAELAAARRLSARGALVRNPTTIEALGRVNTLCFDKTGTLTAGRIVLRRVSDGATHALLTGLDPRYRTIVASALRATPGGKSLPHPTDKAVVAGAAEIAVIPDEGVPGWRRVDELHFEPSRGYHAVLGECEAGHLLSVKGAPEVVLERCTRWARGEGWAGCGDPGDPGDSGDSVTIFDVEARQVVDAEVERLARQGHRVLAVAERAASDRADLDDERVSQLRLVGLLALADPVRPTAAQAVRQLQGAGITVVMVTGDHPSTAQAIAAELGILHGSAVLTGPELDALGDDELAQVLPRVAVFARASPEQKARIVRGLREAGRVVAVTGDGANDAPAIRLADVGIALGSGATAASRAAADLVITDDAIETITEAVVEGRGMWVSVRDAVALLLGGNLGEIIFTVGAGLLGTGDALNARQLLLVNLLTDALPAMAIAVRPPPGHSAEELLAEGPDTSLGSALNREVYLRAAITAGGAGAAWLAGRMLTTRGKRSTVALVALVATQLGQTMAVRGRTPLVLGAGIASLAALVTIVQLPGLSHLFGCRPLSPLGWAVALSSATLATAGGLVVGQLSGPVSPAVPQLAIRS